MKRNFTILILAFTLTTGCNSKRTDLKELGNCSIEFEIDQESSIAYKYYSETGRLSKLIDPFKDEPLYADTVVRLPKNQLCELMKLYVGYKVLDYPDHFKPESRIEVTPEPAYRLRFIYQGKTKEIKWTSNTASFETEEAANLNEIITKIDSLILSTNEFKALPDGQYEWL